MPTLGTCTQSSAHAFAHQRAQRTFTRAHLHKRVQRHQEADPRASTISPPATSVVCAAAAVVNACFGRQQGGDKHRGGLHVPCDKAGCCVGIIQVPAHRYHSGTVRTIIIQVPAHRYHSGTCAPLSFRYRAHHYHSGTVRTIIIQVPAHHYHSGTCAPLSFRYCAHHYHSGTVRTIIIQVPCAPLSFRYLRTIIIQVPAHRRGGVVCMCS